MALQWFDGFDAYGSNSDLTIASYYSGINGVQLAVTSGRFGGGAMFDVNGVGLWTFPTALSEFWTGRAVKFTANGTFILFQFTGPNVVSPVDVVLPSGQLTVSGYGTSTLNLLTPGLWHYVEMHYKSATSASSQNGILELWVDGTQVFVTNSLADYGAVTALNLGVGGSTGSESAFCDDIYLVDTTGSAPLNGRLGDVRIGLALPTSDASPNQGTPSSGTSHYAMVNTTPGYGTNHITLADTAGQEERFGIGSLPSTPSTIYAVSVVSVAAKSDAGAATGQNEIVSSGTASLSTTFSILTSAGYWRSFWTTDPNTSAAWTVSAAEAIDIGYVVGAH